MDAVRQFDHFPPTRLAIIFTGRCDNPLWADAMSLGHIDEALRPMRNMVFGWYIKYDVHRFDDQ